MSKFFAGALTLAGVLALATMPAHAAKTKAAQGTAQEEGDADASTSNSQVVEFTCGSGHKITVYKNASSPEKIALRWKNKLFSLLHVSTTTGAHRYEGARTGLVWIEIPAKSMLLDSKRGLQLANDCMDGQQRQASLDHTVATHPYF